MTRDDGSPAFRTTRRILGHVVGVRSGDGGVMDLVDRTFAAWPRVRTSPVVRLRFDVCGGGDATPSTQRTYRLPTDRQLEIRGNGLRARVDTARGVARVRMNRLLLEQPDDVRYGVIEAATLFLLTARDRIPVHAAGIARGETALLLSGPSGAGKSTFAFASLRASAGWGMLSEDCVYLQTEGGPRLWGWPGYLHLDETAGRFFPELRDRAAAVRANGKRKIAVHSDASTHVRSWQGTATLCLLDRSTAGPRIAPVPVQEAVRALTVRLEPGFDRFGDQLPQALMGCLDPVAWRVDAGTDPNHVPALLERLDRAIAASR